MSSRAHGSEEALARLGCGPIAARAKARVLCGGLGFGFTLRAALDVLPRDARVVAAEVVPAVVAWCRGPLAELAGRPLEDPRVEVVTADVGEVLTARAARFDAVLLDVDNGPRALTRAANQALYELDGLEAIREALEPGGVLALWSADPDPDFERRMSRAGFASEAHEVPVPAGRRVITHTIFVGRK